MNPDPRGDAVADDVDDDLLDEEVDDDLVEPRRRGQVEPDPRPLPTASQARHRGALIEMLVSSLLSLTASLVLSIEAVNLAKDPFAQFSCDISSKISCSTVGLSWQASLLGFPNAFLGLIAEPVVITLAVAALGGVRFPRWFMLTAQVIYTIGLAFAYWLFYEAYFTIGALCPWCLLVTVTTTLVFMSMTRINILDDNIRLGSWQPRVKRWLGYGADTWSVLIIFAIIAAMIVFRYV